MNCENLLRDVIGGHRLTEEEAMRLLETRDRSFQKILAAAMKCERSGPVRW